MSSIAFYSMVMKTVERIKDGENLECKNCAWRIDMSDCEIDEDLLGQHDLCGCINDVEMIADEMDGKKVAYVRNIRCVSHRKHGPIWARLLGWCGKEARWFKEKTKEVVS